MSKYISLIFDNNKKGYLISKILTNNFINFNDFIVTDELKNIMLAKNYDDNNELKKSLHIDDTTINNTIHFEFIDFILNWASFLKTQKNKINRTLKKYIYKDFNNLPQNVQMFFNFIIDYNNGNINYKVDNLIKLIPEINKDIFKFVLFTKNNNLILKPNNDINILKDTFREILVNYKINYVYKQSSSFFNINVDNLIKKELEDLNLNNINLGEINYKNIFDKSNLTKDLNEFYINLNKNSKEYEFINLFDKKTCFTTQVKGDNNKCGIYILECLLNYNTDGFLNCNLDDEGFFDVTMEEINSIHPIIALRTLEKFSFEKIYVYEPNFNHNILLIEDYKTWFNRIIKNTSIPSKIIDNIKKNKKFEIYMQNLVDYVNKNPAILNKDIDYKQKKIYQNKEFNNKETVNMIQILDLVETNIKSILEDIKNNKHNIVYLAQIYNNYLKPVYYDKLRKVQDNMNYKIEKIIKVPASSIGLEVIFDKYMNDLISKNIFLLPKDFEKIKSKLQATIELEKEIFEILILLFKYLQYLELFKNYKSEELTKEKIQFITTTYYRYIEKKLNEELEIIKLIKSL